MARRRQWMGQTRTSEHRMTRNQTRIEMPEPGPKPYRTIIIIALRVENRGTSSERDPNRSEPDAMAGIIVTQPHCNICGTCFELKKSLLSVRKSAPPAKWEQLNPNKNCVNSHWKIIKLILILAAILILMRSEEKENAGQSCRVVRRSTYHLAFTTW